MKSEWTPVSKACPRTGLWLVTRDEHIEQCYFQHPSEPLRFRVGDAWLEPGWYNRAQEPVTDVLAWRPLLHPFGEETVPKKSKPVVYGERVGSIQVEASGKTMLHLDIEGGERLEDSLQLNDVRSAVDDLFTALYPGHLGDFRISLYRKEAS